MVFGEILFGWFGVDVGEIIDNDGWNEGGIYY